MGKEYKFVKGTLRKLSGHSWHGKHKAGGRLAIGAAAHVGYNTGRRLTSGKKEEKIHGDDIHSGITSTGYTVYCNKKPKSVLPKTVFHFNEGYSFGQTGSGNAGSQRVNCWYATTVSQIMVGGSSDLGNNGTFGSLTLMALNPNEYNGGSTVLSNTAVGTNKFCVRSVAFDIHLRNLTTNLAETDVYLLESQKYHNQEADVLWAALAKTHALGLGAASQPAAGQRTGGSGGYANQFTPGQNPRLYKEFNKFWRVKKIHHINFSAGSQEKVHFTVHSNRIVDIAKIVAMNPLLTANDTSTWINASIVNRFVPGTLCVMLVSKGGIVRDATVGGAANNFTYGDVEVGGIMHKRYNMSLMKNVINDIDFNGIYEQISYGTTLANQKEVDINDAVVSAQQA